jgi:hypothetical protein
MAFEIAVETEFEIAVKTEDAATLERRQVWKRVQFATFLCLIFTVLEVVGLLVCYNRNK